MASLRGETGSDGLRETVHRRLISEGLLPGRLDQIRILTAKALLDRDSSTSDSEERNCSASPPSAGLRGCGCHGSVVLVGRLVAAIGDRPSSDYHALPSELAFCDSTAKIPCFVTSVSPALLDRDVVVVHWNFVKASPGRSFSPGYLEIGWVVPLSNDCEADRRPTALSAFTADDASFLQANRRVFGNRRLINVIGEVSAVSHPFSMAASMLRPSESHRVFDGRHWCFTTFHARRRPSFAADVASYYCFRPERCVWTDRYVYQGFVCLARGMTTSEVESLAFCEKWRFEPARGSVADNILRCQQMGGERFKEVGRRPSDVAESRASVLRPSEYRRLFDGRQWFFATFDARLRPSFAADVASYYCFRPETCPWTGRDHYEGFVCLARGMSTSEVESLASCEKWRFEPARRSVAFKVESCQVLGGRRFEEVGRRPDDPSAVAESTASRQVKNAESDNFFATPYGVCKGLSRNLHPAGGIIRQRTPFIELRGGSVCDLWICGPSGLGKSRRAFELGRQKGLYVKTFNKYWKGYDMQPVVLLDGLDKNHECMGRDIRQWSGNFAFRAYIKASSPPVFIRPLNVIVTSRYLPEEIWRQDDMLLDSIQNRFDVRVVSSREEVSAIVLPDVQYREKEVMDISSSSSEDSSTPQKSGGGGGGRRGGGRGSATLGSPQGLPAGESADVDPVLEANAPSGEDVESDEAMDDDDDDDDDDDEGVSGIAERSCSIKTAFQDEAMLAEVDWTESLARPCHVQTAVGLPDVHYYAGASVQEEDDDQGGRVRSAAEEEEKEKEKKEEDAPYCDGRSGVRGSGSGSSSSG